ncbi:MAG: tRNA threonylcarbamoyladenosine dehydratase [Clostridia bacterium]|nr:tRNA threonylcarbamoyladenosine dehydratase [Clostridia bacterium]
MHQQHSRTAALIGETALSKLAHARVAVFGIGGVGGYITEALARAGVGALDLIDSDEVSVSNINRQIIALHSTVGRPKVAVMAERIRDINPDCTVHTYERLYLPENAEEFDLPVYDYIADAIDTVSAKIELAVRARALNVPIIAAMGAGNKLDPTAFEVSDISKTTVCPLARVMRLELRRRGVNHLKVVYSKEPPVTAGVSDEGGIRRNVPTSISFVPGAMGLIMASEIVKDLMAK